MLTITDASFARETYEDEKGNKKMHRSQKARMHLLCSPEILTGDKCDCHILGWSSTTDKRVSSSTMQAEGHAMITGTDNGDKLRAAICSAYDRLDRQKWEESCAKQMIHLWLSDCNALVTLGCQGVWIHPTLSFFNLFSSSLLPVYIIFICRRVI